MRRSELIEAINELINALKESGVSELIGKTEKERGERGSHASIQMLEALKNYAVLAHNFKPITKRLTQILSLLPLEDTSRWLIYVEPNPPTLRMRQNVVFAITHLPKIIDIIEPEVLRHLKEETEAGSKYKGMQVLSVTVFEPENLFSSPLRLANVLESINHFYTACALMENESPSTLSVIACDSGSDKSFDFLGLAKVMECVERIIGTIWDRAFFFRERQFEERLELVAKTLPVIERIDTMEKQKQIDPEMAEILRRNILDGSNKFLQSGATIPKIGDKSEYNPRSLLSPVQKLLVSAPDEQIEESNVHEAKALVDSGDNSQEEKKESAIDFSALTPEEQEQLIRLVQKSKYTKSNQASLNDTNIEASVDASPDDQQDDELS